MTVITLAEVFLTATLGDDYDWGRPQLPLSLSKSFSHFVTSTSAPIASGWSDGRVSLPKYDLGRTATECFS